MSKDITELSIRSILSSDKYMIPLYQRNFAWTAREVGQLLLDIDHFEGNAYYLGSLVVSRMADSSPVESFEVIDGQQRLTALNILYSLLLHQKEVTIPSDLRLPGYNLTFECREKSSKAIALLRETGALDSWDKDSSLDAFREAMQTVNNFFDHKGKDSIVGFLRKLLDKVLLFRIVISPLVDKNHYFEVMNNRGEQLEAHEILKARFMDRLDDKVDREVFSRIWDGCSQMNKRIERTIGLLQDDQLMASPRRLTFGEIKQQMKAPAADTQQPFSISDIESYALPEKFTQDDGKREVDYDTYTSVIDFSNFLLMVLCLTTTQQVTLDASNLLREFHGEDDPKQLPDPKLFVESLLWYRLLLDRYVIKRKKTANSIRGWRWVIEMPKKRADGQLYFVNMFNTGETDEDVEDNNELGTNKRLCMLESMLFVTFRRDVYMYWLRDALQYLNGHAQSPSLGEELIAELEDYCNRFVHNEVEGEEITSDEYRKEWYNIHHFIFNYLDYLLWRIYATNDNRFPEVLELINRPGTRDRFKNFLFTRRNSIEHCYAQEKGRQNGTPETVINDFGNLALISRGYNSRLSDRVFAEKKLYYRSDVNNPMSLKQELMFSEDQWTAAEIEKHGALMVRVLNQDVNYFEDYVPFAGRMANSQY